MQETKRQIIQTELERRIIHGLACEWESALWVLDPEQRALMRKPLFRLSDMKKRLGTWTRENREICISRLFALNHPWDAVREVVVHEMAHQFSTEVLAAGDEAPHGLSFQHACRLLRANPKASGRYPSLHDRAADDASDPEDKIMLRVRKLMALAESRNRYEAEAAMAKSRELIKKYNIDLLKRNEARHFKSIFVGKPALRHFREAYHLSHLLDEFYFVQGLWVPAYVLERGKMGRVLEITGTVRNLEISEYIYNFITFFIDHRWENYNRDKGLNRYRKTDFAVGIIEGFRTKLAAEDKKRKGSGRKALVMVKDPVLREYMGYRYPHTTRFSRGGASQDRGVLTDGMDLGRRMVISKGIAEKVRGRVLYIESHGRNMK